MSKKKIGMKEPKQRKWDEVTSGELMTNIEYLQCHHDPVLARNVIELFHERMEDGEHINMDALYLLSRYAFAKIIEGKTADQAFGLKLARGQYERPDTDERDMAAAALITLLMRKGNTWEDAILQAAETFAMGDSTVARNAQPYVAATNTLPEEILQEWIDAARLSP